MTRSSLPPITSTHLLPYPCHELVRQHASHTAPGLAGPPSTPAYMLPLMLPDYSAAANQYSQALGMGAPLELLLLNVRSFTGIGGG